MDGHAELIGPPGTVDAFEMRDADSQGELFGEFRHVENGMCVSPLIETQHFDDPGAPRAGLLDTRLRAQESERLKLGRELHDSTGQLLLALRLEIAHLRQVQGTSAEKSLLDEIDQTACEIDREIRAFAFIHYPAEIGRDGLGSALRSLASGFARRTGLTIRFTSIPDPIARSGPTALALLRIAQEALLNVHRHAQAAHVHLMLTARQDQLEMSIRDDGVGIPSVHSLEDSHGVGLQGMRHRVERLGGRFAIRRLKQGAKIVVTIPA
jgi:signal transduction histidine kinase